MVLLINANAIKKRIKLRNRLFRRYAKSMKEIHKTSYEGVRNQIKELIQQAKIRHRQHIVDQILDNNTGPDQYWKLHKKVCDSTKSSNIPTLVDNNTIFNTPIDKANLMCEYFASLSTAPVTPDVITEEMLHLNESNETFLSTLTVTPDEVTNALKQIKAKSATGPDNISNTILKRCADMLNPSLTYIFNKSLRDCQFPSMWK